MSDTAKDPLAKIKHKIQEEILALEHELTVDLPKEIAKARAHGDLSENSEYKYAKERQGFVNARVWVLDLKKSVEVEYKLVTTEEADASQGMISTTSPIGKALLNRQVGEEVQVQTPAGIKAFELVRLRTIHEEE